MKKNTYLPVDLDFIEDCENLVNSNLGIKVHYFGNKNSVELAAGIAQNVLKNREGIFLNLENEQTVRLDKVITLNGKPGPAYDEYDRYANVCLTCEDLDQF